MKPAYVVALVILAGSLGFTLYAFSGSVAQHVTVKQAMAKPGETVQVPGDIVKETVGWSTARGELRFDVIDKQDPSARMTVVYRSPKPENFDSATSVEAVGRYEDGVFKAHDLLVKCPSKYSDEKGKAQTAPNPA